MSAPAVAPGIPMRLKSDFFVAALVRRAMIEGAFAAATRKGAAEAGAIFVLVDRLDGTADLYGPAPQFVVDDKGSERLFESLARAAPRFELVERLVREARFDSDIWIVEIEDRDGRPFVDLAPSA